MKFDIERSKVYDTIKYFSLNFNYNKEKEKSSYINLDPDTCFYNYSTIKDEYLLSNDYHAFFACYNNKTDLLTLFLESNIDKIHSLNDLLLNLNSTNFKSFFYDYHFDSHKIDYTNICAEDIYKLDTESNIKVSLMAIFLKYDEIITKLCYDIEHVYLLINCMFKEQKDILKKFELNSGHIKILENISKDKVSKDDIYYISLLIPYVCRFCCIKNKYHWVLGIKSKIALEKEEQFKYRNISYKSVSALINNEVNIEILNYIYKNKEVNPAKIIDDNTYISPATIYRVLNNLVIEKAIYVSKKTKKSVYYSIDTNYFKYAKIKIDDFLTYYLGEV